MEEGDAGVGAEVMKATKAFDCLNMKRRIQERIYEETKDMTAEELAAYFHNRIAKSRFASFLDRPVSDRKGLQN